MWRRLTTYDGVARGAVSLVHHQIVCVAEAKGMTAESLSESTGAELAGLFFAVALIILAIVFSAAPAVGSMVCAAAEINTSSDWAASDIPSGVDIWKDGATFVTLIILLSVISLIMFYIRMMG